MQSKKVFSPNTVAPGSYAQQLDYLIISMANSAGVIGGSLALCR